MRPLLLLLTMMLTLAASGLSSAIAASGGDDCCGDRSGGAAERGEDPGEGGDEDRCPPFCHSCACTPLFEEPRLATPHAVVVERTAGTLFAPAGDPPPEPPGPRVFHPPR